MAVLTCGDQRRQRMEGSFPHPMNRDLHRKVAIYPLFSTGVSTALGELSGFFCSRSIGSLNG